MVQKLTKIVKWLHYIRKNWTLFVKNGKKFNLKKKEKNNNKTMQNTKMKWLILKMVKLNNLTEF